ITNDKATAGVPNVLRVRERDQAGNASSESSIVMTTDVVPPKPVTMNNFWTDNASGGGIVRWQPGGDPDVASYNVYYAAASNNPGGLPDGGTLNADAGYLMPDGGYIVPVGYTGFYASQGSSPIPVGVQTYATLDGLPNGAVTYVTVRAVDRAGNVGP